MKKNSIYIIVAAIVFCSFTFIGPVQETFARDKFKESNDIDFYDNSASKTGCIDATSSVKTLPAGKNNEETIAIFLTSTNFAGNNKLPLNAIQMAALMGNLQTESKLDPSSGVKDDNAHKGLARWDSNRWKVIADTKTDLTNQLDYIQKELDGEYKDKLDDFWKASKPEDLIQANYAIAMNYEGAVVKDKKPPTLWSGTNDKDATDNIQGWASRKNDANHFYDTYSNLSKTGSTSGSNCSGALTSGGMTLAEAKSFMNEYKNLKPSDWPESTAGTKYNLNGTTCSGGSLANCVAFSQYFINRYTKKQFNGPGNGERVVGQLIGLDFKNGGNTPKIYAVFSQAGYKAVPTGHTGVVLGIDTKKGKIIIGEASCGSPLSEVDANEYDLSKFSSKEYTYAYTDGMLKDGEL